MNSGKRWVRTVCMTIDYPKFDGDSHESSAHWLGMTCSDGPPNSHLSVCWRKPAITLSHISIFFISYLFSTPPVECGEINCGNSSRESAKKIPVENQEILHNRLWRKSACPVLLFSTFPHKIPLLRLLLQKPMI